jgi:thiamine pyrophosphate-dependent acetolactate synthase large subunit-like protein
VDHEAEDSDARRRFLTGTLLGAAGMVAVPAVAAPPSAAPSPAKSSPAAPDPQTPITRAPWLIAAESQLSAADTAADRAVTADSAQYIVNPGSDFMVDVMRSLGIEYVAVMPGSTFRGLHESLVNYGDTRRPALVVCTHEEAAAGIAHGYAKVSGRPMACLVHSNVGLQHASMAMYNAWCDRAPMLVIAGNVLDATKRRPGVEWYHTAQDLGALVRDYTKWDDTPISLQHFAESFVRAYTTAMTPPMAPALIVADAELQEDPISAPSQLRIPTATSVAPPAADESSLERAARVLVSAEQPLIVADRGARTAAGMAQLVRLAEMLNAPVIDQLSRMNFPTSHYLNQTWRQNELVASADVILALELSDLWGTVNAVPDIIGRPSRRIARGDARVVSISAEYLYLKSNMQDFERFYAADQAVGADAEASLPGLIAAVDRQLDTAGRARIAARTPELKQSFAAMRAKAQAEAAVGWDASPISTARLCQEIWAQIRHDPWALVSSSSFISRWPQRLWDFTEYHQYIGGEGGFGVGYGAPAAVGAALAHRDAGRIAINIQTDGDLLVLPCVLWTLAHHSIPLLTVMHNNRAWHQEAMHVTRMALRRDRTPVNGTNGTIITDPPIDYAQLARSMGVWAEGPIDDPTRLAASLSRALAVVRGGRPALIDVVTQPR